MIKPFFENAELMERKTRLYSTHLVVAERQEEPHKIYV